MLRSAFTVGLLLICACAAGAEPETTVPEEMPDGLVAWDSDSIAVFDDPGSGVPRRQLETGGLAVSQVTPSPDGRVVWTGAATDGSGFTALVTSLNESISVEIDVPTPPFFYSWSPRADRVAFLGNDPGGTGVLFGSLDPSTGDAQRHGVATPFFLDWSPDGAEVAANIGGARLGIVEIPAATVEDLGVEPGRFATPLWTPNGLFVVRPRTATVRGALQPVSLQVDAEEIIRIDVASGERSTIATSAVPIRLFGGSDGERLAIVGGPIGRQRLVVFDVESASVIADRAAGSFDLVQWSPDGSALLYTTREGRATSLIPWVYRPDEDVLHEFEAFTPSDELATVYLPFWDQYERALRLWSADSEMFALATAGDRVRLVPLDGEPVEVAGFSMAVFAELAVP